MWIYLIVILAFGSLLSVAIVMASKNGSKAAQLEALKAEIRKLAEEEARAKRINNFANGLSGDDAREKLHQIANSINKK